MEGFLVCYADEATVWISGMPAEARGKDEIRQVARLIQKSGRETDRTIPQFRHMRPGTQIGRSQPT